MGGQEPVKAPEAPVGNEGICGPTVVVLLAMMVLVFRRKKTPSQRGHPAFDLRDF